MSDAISTGKLRPEVKAKWLKALRSGDYRQGQNFLHYQDQAAVDRFCCLGVLCDLAVKEGVATQGGAPTQRGHRTTFRYGPLACTLPPESVEEWAYETAPDLSNPPWHVPGSGEGGLYEWLPELNDEAGLTFNQIADVIEELL